MIAAYKKPRTGDLLKTTCVVNVYELINEIPSKQTYIKENELVLLLGLLGTDKYIVFYNNKKYIYTQRPSRVYAAHWIPFTIVC